MKKSKKLHKRHILALGLAVVLFAAAFPNFGMQISAAPPTSAAISLAEAIGTKDAPQRLTIPGLEITGQIPHAQMVSIRLEEELNERFTAQRNAFEQNHLASALSIHFDSRNYISDNFVSVVFTKEAISASLTSAISTTVIDAGTRRIISLPDYHVNILQLINGYINNKISANPRGFVADFNGIDANHPFYLDYDRLVIPFGSAELIPDNRNIHKIELSISNIQHQTFDSSYFQTLPPHQYNTVMIRLTDVITAFGYDFDWIYETRTVNIFMGGSLVSYVTFDENSYHYRHHPARELEIAPMAFNGRTYVPLSFFSEIMGIPTTITPSGIVMSRYHFESALPVSMADLHHLE